jgi:hypothetical protein
MIRSSELLGSTQHTTRLDREVMTAMAFRGSTTTTNATNDFAFDCDNIPLFSA